MEPTSYVIACRSPAANNLVVAAATTHVPRPTTLARLLAMHVSLSEPDGLPPQIHPGIEGAHRPLLVADESVARCQVAIRRDAEVTRTRAAPTWTMSAPVELAP